MGYRPFKYGAAGPAIGALVTLISPTYGGVIYVDDTAPPTSANDGTSWENAFFDLQDALKIAQAGDEVRLGQGVYKPAPPNGSRELSFLVPNGVIVQGGYAGYGADNPDELDHKTFVTTLDGDLNGDDGPNFQNYAENSYNVVLADGVDASTTLNGLVIQGGHANYYDNSWPYDHRMYGGGIHGLSGAVLTMIDCTIRDNRSHYGGGGGVYIKGLAATRCQFINNQADSAAMSPGGGLRLAGPNAAAVLEECIFFSNFAGNTGGAIYGGEKVVLRKCRFENNYSNEAAGAISASECLAINTDFINNTGWHGVGAASCSNSTFVNCRFLDNGAGCIGSSSALKGSNLNLINCLFSGNHGSNSTLWGSANLIANCTFVGNKSLGCWGGAAISASVSVMVNTIVWGNQYDDSFWPPTPIQEEQISSSPATLANNIIQGWDGSLGGVNNSGDDPQFIDADGPDNDYGTEDDNPRLSPNSPAINAGDNSFLPADEFDLDNDGDTSEPLPLDLDGLPRIVNGIVDLGPFEYPEPVETCGADIAPPGGNDIVNVDDLLLVIDSWGTCADPDNCPADITNNGIVDVDDLLSVIDNWGACD